jgi:hypothetical protein
MYKEERRGDTTGVETTRTKISRETIYPGRYRERKSSRPRVLFSRVLFSDVKHRTGKERSITAIPLIDR